MEHLYESRGETLNPELHEWRVQTSLRRCHKHERRVLKCDRLAFARLVFVAHLQRSKPRTDRGFNRPFVTECGEQLARNEWFAAYFQLIFFFFSPARHSYRVYLHGPAAQRR